MKKTKNTPKPAARKPAPATLPAQLVESDSPNGPWTPIPDDAVEVRALDLDLARMENPILDEYVPIDHRTPWGSELLGFAYLGTLHEHFPPPCYMRQLREWLLKRGIDWRIVSESPTPWSDFIHLLRGDKPEEARPKVAGGATQTFTGWEVPWDPTNPDFIEGDKARVKYTGSRMPASTLSRKLGSIRVHYQRMRGKGSRVHEREFQLWALEKYPEANLTGEQRSEITDETLADRAAIKAAIRRQ